MSTKGDLRKLVKKAVKRGWKKLDSGRRIHVVLEWTNGARVTSSLTPSDHHAVKNFEADMRRIEKDA
tara:strand:- start:377 stop:577 length:201 start_codon:yes stop_codon:yes gene_type:complete